MATVPRPAGAAAWPSATAAALALASASSSGRCRRRSARRSCSTRSRSCPTASPSILSEDHSTPIVHVEVWYHVGSKNERPGRTGFAHLFEHMMFKGSKNVEPEAHTSFIVERRRPEQRLHERRHDRLLADRARAVPAAVLWLEADRMATLRINKDTFEKERLVVKEERRMRVENQPYGRLLGDHLRQGVHGAPLQAPADRHAWRISRPPRSRTCATSTAPSTCRRMRR